MNKIAKRVLRVPDKNPAMKIPTVKKTIAFNFSVLFEFLQSATQNIEIPSITNEKGIGLPENNVSLSLE